MKLTEAEAIVKLEHVGLPTYGTYDELIERLERNGLVPKSEQNPVYVKQHDVDLDKLEEQPTFEPNRRGRPRGSK